MPGPTLLGPPNSKLHAISFSCKFGTKSGVPAGVCAGSTIRFQCGGRRPALDSGRQQRRKALRIGCAGSDGNSLLAPRQLQHRCVPAAATMRCQKLPNQLAQFGIENRLAATSLAFRQPDLRKEIPISKIR